MTITGELTKEELLSRTPVDEVLVRNAEDLHDARQLFLLVLAGEYWEAGVKLGEDAPEAPHVDGHMVVHSEDDLGRTVESTLDVRVDWKRALVE